MPNTTSWHEIRKRRPPNESAVALEKLQLRLAMLRERLGTSQVELAEKLGTSQSNVSQLERSNDQMLSSVARYVHALGGELKIAATIGETTYTLLDDVVEIEARPDAARRSPPHLELVVSSRIDTPEGRLIPRDRADASHVMIRPRAAATFCNNSGRIRNSLSTWRDLGLGG